MSPLLQKIVARIAAFAAVATTASFAVPQVAAAETAKGKLKFALNWKPEPEFGGFYAAQLGGYFKEKNLDVEIIPGGVGTPVVQMVAAGSVAFGIAGADEIVISRARGSDVTALFAVHQTNPQGIMVRADRQFKAIGDAFQQGSVAMQQGLPYYLFLEKKFGPFKAKIVPFLGGVTQMLKDKTMSQQGYVTLEPLLAKQQGLDTKFFLNAEAGYNPYGTVVITRRSFIKENPQLVDDMLAAIEKGWNDYNKDPKATNVFIAKLNPTLDRQTLDDSAAIQLPLSQSDTTKQNGLGSMTPARWEELAAQLKELKLIDKVEPAGDYFYTRKAAAPKPAPTK